MDYCSCCGAKMAKHKHVLNRGMVESLIKLCDHKKANLKTLNLPHNQWLNFQKLHYWGLVNKYYKNGKHLGGWWEATPLAYNFIKGLCTVPKYVLTFRNKTIEEDKERTHVTDVIKNYMFKQREDYARDAEPAGLFDGGLSETY